ncbi:MAG: hypothetical protein IPQ02_07005 [Saprospiraceae bacterium]|nr:hypothetical protein [Candidatus Defluviibacterium haderslevense]
MTRGIINNTKISKDSLIIIFSNQIKRDPFHRESILLMQSFIDKLETKSQIKFYIDNIYVPLYPDSNEKLNPPPRIRRPNLNSSLDTYYMSILASRSYNTDSVISYIINNKLSSCELKEPIIGFYVKLMRILKKNNITSILDSVTTKNDSCSQKNAELLKYSFKYI